MHDDSNIAREDKLKELNQKISNKNLVDKAYKMVSSTEYYHLQHDPYNNGINNDMTVKSCILDNSNNKIYFSYAEKLAGLDQFLEYDISTQKVSIFKEAKVSPTLTDLNSKLAYYKWQKATFTNKQKRDNEYYMTLIEYFKNSSLEPAYKYRQIAMCYTNIENKEKSYEYAKKYLHEVPKYNTAYYSMAHIQNHFKDYKAAIDTYNLMMQKAIMTPADYYWCKRNLIKILDKLQAQSPDQKNIDKIKQLAKEVNEEANKYFLAKWIKKDLTQIDEIVAKYN